MIRARGDHQIRASARFRCHGFSLVEAFAAMTVIITIGSLASVLVFASVDSYASAATSAQLQTEASLALDRITRELSNIPLDSGAATLAPNIDSLTPTSIAWSAGSSISLSGSQIFLAIGGNPAEVLLDDVTSLQFSAEDEAGQPLVATLNGAACDPIRRITITLAVQRHGQSETVRTKLYLRCAMTGAAQ